MSNVLTIAQSELAAYLKPYRAQFRPQQSDATRHIYLSRNTGRWIKVKKNGPNTVAVSFHAECPCSDPD